MALWARSRPRFSRRFALPMSALGPGLESRRAGARGGPGRGAPTRRGGTAALRPGHAPAALPARRLGRASFGTAFGGGRGSAAREPRRGGAGWQREGRSSPALSVTPGRLRLRAAALLPQVPLPRSPRGGGPVPSPSRTPPLARLPPRRWRARLSSAVPVPSSPRRRRKEAAAGPPRPRMRQCRAGAALPRSGAEVWVSFPPAPSPPPL